MTTTFGQANFVQTSFTDNFTRGFAGQLASAADHIANVVETYPGEEDIIMGNGVVIGVEQPLTTPTSTPPVYASPFSVTNPTGVSTLADLVGIAVRPYIVMDSVINANSETVGAYLTKSSVAVLPFNSNARILVRLEIGQAIATNDAVSMAIAATNDAGDIPVGQFGVDSGGGTGLLLIANAKWWMTKTATAGDRIGVIRLFRTNS